MTTNGKREREKSNTMSAFPLVFRSENMVILHMIYHLSHLLTSESTFSLPDRSFHKAQPVFVVLHLETNHGNGSWGRGGGDTENSNTTFTNIIYIYIYIQINTVHLPSYMHVVGGWSTCVARKTTYSSHAHRTMVK